MEKDIDFANTPICQSCGMPLTSPEQFGKNADGTGKRRLLRLLLPGRRSQHARHTG